MPEPMPEEISEQIVAGIDPGGIGGVDLVLSALPSSIAGPVEDRASQEGVSVVSNASVSRLDPDIPLLNPGSIGTA